jgi:predicted ester cyclase
MLKKNAEIVREYFNDVINAHNIDRIYDYLDKKCVFHTPPYVGLGLRWDEKPGEKLVITAVAEKGPCYGKLMAGDEAVRIQDEHGIAETFEQLKNGFYGLGRIGTPVSITVRRGEKLLDFTAIRSRIEGFDNVMSDDQLEGIRKFFTEIIPDYKAEIKVILEDGDKVAIYLISSGTSQEFHASAVWPECSIWRLENGKIVETWGVEDNLSWNLQMGYQLKEPVKEMD